MRMRSILASTVFAAATMLGAGAASAATVLGVNIPSDFYMDTTNSYETLVTKTGQTLQGVFNVASIIDTNTSVQTYTAGQNNVWVHGFFDNFVVSSVSGTTITFTGGTLKYYVSTGPTNVFTNSGGSVAADIAAASTGTLLLDVAPVSINGITLQIDITTGTLASFLDSHAQALGDVVGGALAPFLDSNVFDGHDVLFDGHAHTTRPGISCGTDFAVCGSNTLSALVVPEPITLSVFGAGLAGVAALRRRKGKKA